MLRREYQVLEDGAVFGDCHVIYYNGMIHMAVSTGYVPGLELGKVQTSDCSWIEERSISHEEGDVDSMFWSKSLVGARVVSC